MKNSNIFFIPLGHSSVAESQFGKSKERQSSITQDHKEIKKKIIFCYKLREQWNRKNLFQIFVLKNYTGQHCVAEKTKLANSESVCRIIMEFEDSALSKT